MRTIILLLTLSASLSSCGQSTTNQKTIEQELDCGPDAPEECSFLNMPESVGSIMKIPADEGPEKLKITGRIFKADGKTPYPNVLLYVYHTDAKGLYSKSGQERGVQKWHGRHHGWVKTDKEGNYMIHSIRPAQYPGNTSAAHIHAIVREPGKKPYWINDYVFNDDPFVTEGYKASQRNAGGDGVLDVQLVNGRWEGVRIIVLKE